MFSNIFQERIFKTYLNKKLNFDYNISMKKMTKKYERKFFNFLVKQIYTEEFIDGKNICVIISEKDGEVVEVKR